jgi:4-diphosphocytidyl-2C-methyl-D-erythritol kinase
MLLATKFPSTVVTAPELPTVDRLGRDVTLFIADCTNLVFAITELLSPKATSGELDAIWIEPTIGSRTDNVFTDTAFNDDMYC